MGGKMKIWGRYQNKEPELIDTCSKSEAEYMLYNYLMAFGALPGQHAHKDWKLWLGRKKDEPRKENYYQV